MMRQALERGDLGEYQALESQTSKRGRLLKELRQAVEEERYFNSANAPNHSQAHSGHPLSTSHLTQVL